MGTFPAGVRAWVSLRHRGQLIVGELVDRYPVACRPLQDLIVAYLAERQPSAVCGTVVSLCCTLVTCFWADPTPATPASTS